MHAPTPVEKMRQAIATELQRLGARDPQAMHETILIYNGLFCGRKFQCNEYQALWFLEENEIKFFGPCGDLLKSSSANSCIQGLEGQIEERRAA